MNAPASPGRTWIIFGLERQLPDLAATSATAVFRGGRRFAGVPGVAGLAASPPCADSGCEGDASRERGHQLYFDRRLDCDFDSLRVKDRVQDSLNAMQ